MSYFLKKLIVFLIFPLVIVSLSDTYLRNKNSLYKEKFHGALKQSEKVEVLILGNSHANYGVDPTVFNNYAYNLANVNQSLYFDKRITLKLIDELENLKYVLISSDYHSLYFSDQGLRNFWSYQGHGISYKGDNFFLQRLSPSLFGYPPKVTLSYLKRDLNNFILHNNKGVNFPVQRGVGLSDSLKQGFIAYSNSDLDAFSTEKYQSRAKTFNQEINRNYSEESEIKEDLIDFIEILKFRGQTPILFTTPTFNDYNVHLKEEILKANQEFFENLSEKCNIPYWNFMDSQLFNKQDFYDADHLNKTGAKKFGLILNDSIIKLRN